MNQPLFKFLSVLCLLSSSTCAKEAKNEAKDNTTIEMPSSTSSSSTRERGATLMPTDHFANTTKYQPSQTESAVNTTGHVARGERSTPTSTPSSTPTSTPSSTNTSTPSSTPTPTSDGHVMKTVGILALLILILIVVFCVLFRWYSRSPSRRSFRSLCGSLAERAETAWAAVAAWLQTPQKQPEDEEAEETGVGGGGQEGAGEGDGWGSKGDEEEDDSSDNYFSKEGGEEERNTEEHGEEEEMTTVLLGDEKINMDEEDDFTPL